VETVMRSITDFPSPLFFDALGALQLCANCALVSEVHPYCVREKPNGFQVVHFLLDIAQRIARTYEASAIA
jgi:hypothetical protein